jgi:rod shape-determining protein MreC
MRLRKRHAWGAVLIALFALPVLRPDGFPSVERPGATFLGWFARTPVLNPRLWRSGDGDGVEDSPAVRALLVDRAKQYEEWARHWAKREGLERLSTALEESGLDRLPSVRGARVLRTADPSGYRQAVLIDRGAEDGVQEGLAVVDGDVLLGRAKVVHGRQTLVQLVTDPDARLEVAVRTQRDRRVRGFLHGAVRGLSSRDLEIRFARVTDDTGPIEVGAPVFTSNADDRVPAGLLVGFVREVSDPDVDRAPTLRMRPALDLDRALDVFVVIPAH